DCEGVSCQGGGGRRLPKSQLEGRKLYLQVGHSKPEVAVFRQIKATPEVLCRDLEVARSEAKLTEVIEIVDDAGGISDRFVNGQCAFEMAPRLSVILRPEFQQPQLTGDKADAPRIAKLLGECEGPFDKV